MRRAVLLFFLCAAPAHGFDSVCFVDNGPRCTPGPQAARNRWLGPSDEHRALLELSRIFGGLPQAVRDDFTLPVFTSDAPVDVAGTSTPSLEPVNFVDAARLQERTMSVPEFAQLPDHAFALWDWARGLELCPLPVSATADACQDFSTHMGAVNSNHFLPQGQHFYRYYHQLALERAAACADAKSRIESRGGSAEEFGVFLRACAEQALVLEATGQHFLEDAWSTGHMWERWGSPDLAAFPSLSEALLVAITSGLIHGAKAVIEDLPVSHPGIAGGLAAAGFDVTQYQWDDPLCAPHPEVAWVGPGQVTPAPGTGDLFLVELITGQGASFPDQFRQLFSCGAAGLREVYAAAGEPHGPMGPLAGGLVAVDPTSEACFGQRATNRALARGMGLDFVDPDGTPQRVALTSPLATFLVPALAAGVGATVTPALLARFWIDTALAAARVQIRSVFFPDATDLAAGGLGRFVGVDPNGAFVTPTLAPYVDPPLPWPATGTSAEAERATWLARTFHRAHALEWCNRFRPGAADRLDVEALRAKVEMLLGSGVTGAALDAACAACAEFAARHLRVGTGPDDYFTGREPLCFHVADDPDAAQYVYQDGEADDAVERLAGRYCGCELRIEPAEVTLDQGATQQFQAIRFGAPTTDVVWSATGGTIDASGLFTAGSTAGTFEVRAAAPDGQSATATVVVNAGVDCTPPGDYLLLRLLVTFLDTENKVGGVDATLTDSLQLEDRRVTAELSIGSAHVSAELDEGTFRSEGEVVGAHGTVLDFPTVIPDDPALIGTIGTIAARVEVTATGSATGDGVGLWRLRIIPGLVERVGSFTGNGYTGDAPGLHELRFPIVFGAPPPSLNLTFTATAHSAVVVDRPGNGSAQIDVTYRFLGYTDARDDVGNPVAFSLCTNLPN